MADRVKMTDDLEGSRGGDRSVLLLAVSYVIITIIAVLLARGLWRQTRGLCRAAGEHSSAGTKRLHEPLIPFVLSD